MSDPRFLGHIDSTRIIAAGFSFGGWTALSLAQITRIAPAMHFTALPLCNPAAEEIPSERGLETKTPAPPFEALVPLIGLEPTTPSLRMTCSTI